AAPRGVVLDVAGAGSGGGVGAAAGDRDEEGDRRHHVVGGAWAKLAKHGPSSGLLWPWEPTALRNPLGGLGIRRQPSLSASRNDAASRLSQRPLWRPYTCRAGCASPSVPDLCGWLLETFWKQAVATGR